MTPGAGAAALIIFLPFALASHALASRHCARWYPNDGRTASRNAATHPSPAPVEDS